MTPLISRRMPAERSIRRSSSLLTVVSLTALLPLGLGSCGQTISPRALATRTVEPSPTVRVTPKSAYVTFAVGVSYPAAVHTVTDLGLQARTFCEGIAYSPPGAAASTQGWWEQEASALDFPVPSGPDAGRGLLYVSPTPLAPSDWDTRLAATAGVVKEQIYTDEPKCALHFVYTAPPAGAAHYVADDQVGTLVRAIFDERASYDSAVVLVSQLGFRLSEPCYEQARAAGQTPAWHSMGQESSFSSNRNVLVRVTYFNATTWRQQLATNPSVQAVEAPVTVTC